MAEFSIKEALFPTKAAIETNTFDDGVMLISDGNMASRTGEIAVEGDFFVTGSILANSGVISAVYDSVADMVADTGLSTGDTVRTIDYYNDWVSDSIQPSGGNLYRIVSSGTGTNDGGSFINLSNGLQAKGLFPTGVLVTQFGTTNAVSDDTAAVQAAISYVYNSLTTPYGGDVIIPRTQKVKISSDLTVNSNVRLVGEYKYLDRTDKDSWDQQGSTIILNSSASILLYNGCGIRNLLVYRDGMTFPSSSGLTEAQVLEYAGTAFVVNSACNYIGYCTVLGFEWAIVTGTNNTPRTRVEFFCADCTNGIRIDNDLGGWTMDNCLIYPILTSTDATNIRTGVGFKILNRSDWTNITNCFVYQDTGLSIEDSNQIRIVSSGFDHPTDSESGTNTYATGRGAEILGTCTDIFFVGCQTASHLQGFYVNINDDRTVHFTECHVWGLHSINGENYRIDGGNAYINGGQIGGNLQYSPGDGGTGIVVDNANSRVVVSGTVFTQVGTAIDTPNYLQLITSESVTYYDINTAYRANGALKTIASAGSISFPNDEPAFEITGNTTITSLSTSVPLMKKVTLFFASNPTVTHSANLVLNGSVDYSATAGSSLTLMYRGGSVWTEVSRIIV